MTTAPQDMLSTGTFNVCVLSCFQYVPPGFFYSQQYSQGVLPCLFPYLERYITWSPSSCSRLLSIFKSKSSRLQRTVKPSIKCEHKQNTTLEGYQLLLCNFSRERPCLFKTSDCKLYPTHSQVPRVRTPDLQWNKGGNRKSMILRYFSNCTVLRMVSMELQAANLQILQKDKWPGFTIVNSKYCEDYG